MARAINSFPVPVSPRGSELSNPEGAAFATWRSTLRNDSEEPTMSSNIESRSICSRNARFFVPCALLGSDAVFYISSRRVPANHLTLLISEWVVTNEEPAILAILSTRSLTTSNGTEDPA